MDVDTNFYFIYFWISRKYFFDNSQRKIMIWIQLYLLWNVLTLFRGTFFAETYWDWKMLFVNGFELIVPVVVFSSTNVLLLQSILKTFVKYGLPLFVFFAFIIMTDAYGFYLAPFSFFALFLPIIKTPWKWIVFAVVLFVIYADLTARSNVINFFVPIIFSILYYFRFLIPQTIFELTREILFIAPLLFLVLAVYADFNVFKMDVYIKGDYTEKRIDISSQIIDDNQLADSRSFMYIEAFDSAKKYDSWWIGRTPA